MDEIKDVVRNVIGQLSAQKPQEQGKIDDLWQKNLNDAEKKHARIAGLKDGTLTVYVDSPAWLYQFNLKKKKFLNEIQKEFNEIQKIYFKIGKI